jgi:hypothetical protein
LAFSPEQKRCRFHLPVHQCDFYADRALCRDVRRKLELWLDPALLHTLWDPTWNQWKHLLGTKIEVDATFVQSGKYRSGDAWKWVCWDGARQLKNAADKLANEAKATLSQVQGSMTVPGL